MSRIIGRWFCAFSLAAIFFGGATAARAIDNGLLLSLYGEGMKSFYAGSYAQAHDTFTQAIIYLKNDGWFELPRARDPDAPKAYSKPLINPYAA